MGLLVSNIIPRKFAENAQTEQYRVQTNTQVIIDKFTATNTSASNVEFSINLVASGGSALSSNLVLDSRIIAAGESYLCPEIIGQILEDDGYISTICDTLSALTISASARLIT